MRNDYITLNDLALLNECRTFVDNGAGKYEASSGNFDDRIFATAIAWQMRKVPGGTVKGLGERTFKAEPGRAGRIGRL